MELSTVVWWFAISLWAVLMRVCQAGRCEKITVPFCRGLWYNFTSMPNDIGLGSQHDVHFELMSLREMVEARCSPHARRFLCAMYLPRCLWTGPHAMRVEHPCRQDCEIVKNGCEDFLSRGWPRFLPCDRLQNHACLHISSPAAPSIDIVLSRDSTRSSAVAQYLLTLYNNPLNVALLGLFSHYSTTM